MPMIDTLSTWDSYHFKIVQRFIFKKANKQTNPQERSKRNGVHKILTFYDLIVMNEWISKDLSYREVGT